MAAAPDLLEQLLAIKQEFSDFQQAVSDALLRYLAPSHVPHGLKGFIIPEPKPDPLVEVMKELVLTARMTSGDLRAALEVRGLEIREKGQ